MAVAALPGVDLAVIDARHAVDALLSARVLRRRHGEAATLALTRAALASAALELPLVADSGSQPGGSPGGWPGSAPGTATTGPLLQAALRLGPAIPGAAVLLARSPRQALAGLHLAAGGAELPPDQVGRPRGGAQPNDSDPLGLGTAPIGDEVAARLDALCELIPLGLSTVEVPALVAAAVVHLELLVLRPFAAHNGLVARAAARAVLVARSLDPHLVTVPEQGHLELRAEYQMLARGYARVTDTAGAREVLTRWQLHCAAAMVRGAAAGLELLHGN